MSAVNTKRVAQSMVANTNRSLWRSRRHEHNSCVDEVKKTPEALEAGARIRKARKLKGWSLEKLAEKSGIGASTVGNYEQGTREVNIRGARQLARVLGTHPAHLMGLLDAEELRFLTALRAPPLNDGDVVRPFPVPPPHSVVADARRISRKKTY